MKKINVEICVGTACFVMGSGRLLCLVENLSDDLRQRLSIEAALCCNLCRDWANSKPPIVKVGERVITGADEEQLMEAIVRELEEPGHVE